MAPVREIIAETTTVPCVPAARAMAGYTGRIGASNIPAETPVEICNGVPRARGDATEILAHWVEEEPVLKAAGIPSAIPDPMRVVAGGASSGVPGVGRSDGRGERVAVGMAVLVVASEVAGCTRSTWIGGLGGGSINTGRVSVRDIRRSGCSNGRTTSVAAMAHCRVTEASAVHRLPEEM